jgi:hypothetical protein
MKYLVQLSFPYYTYHSLIILNEAERLLQEGHQVDILTCGSGVKRCYANVSGDPSMCHVCVKMQNQWLHLLSPGARTFSYKEFLPAKQQAWPAFVYENPEDIKKLEYKGVKIGYGAYSSYVSRTRNLNPAMTKEFKSFFDELLRTECLSTDILENYIDREKPDSVLMFNARHFEVRPFYDLPKTMNVRVECLEAGFSLVEDRYMGFNYGTFQPHSIEFNHKFMLQQWESSKIGSHEKERVAKEFYERKRGSVAAGGKVFTADQKLGTLPEGWDNSKRNIVIFNSSEDEFVAVGDEYSRKAMFADQFAGINAILELLKDQPDIHVYVRVHPAQRNVPYKYHHDLYKLPSKFDNVTVIHATDKVSSYTLIDSAEKVVVFGSTIGMEAAYWNKPVILLAGALYYYLNDVYVPKDKSELSQMLKAELTPRKSSDSLRFGYFMMTERGYALEKIRLSRSNKIPFKPMKINRESIMDLIVRFRRVKKFSELEYSNLASVPKEEA